MKSQIVFFILFLLITASCNKQKNEMIITGKIYSPNEQYYMSNAKVILEGQTFVNNTWNSNYNVIASAYSDASGNYRIEHEKVRANSIRLKVAKAGYITEIKDLNYENIIPGEEYYVNINIYPKSYLLIKVKNEFPANDSDELTVTLSLGTENCPTCLQSGHTTFEGANVNDSIFGIVYGEKDYTIQWTINNNGNIEQHSQNVHCSKNDTATVNITY
jgi:hypothetical protein